MRPSLIKSFSKACRNKSCGLEREVTHQLSATCLYVYKVQVYNTYIYIATTISVLCNYTVYIYIYRVHIQYTVRIYMYTSTCIHTSRTPTVSARPDRPHQFSFIKTACQLPPCLKWDVLWTWEQIYQLVCEGTRDSIGSGRGGHHRDVGGRLSQKW